MLSYLKKISVAESAISKFERLAIVAIFEKHDASQASLLGKAINESQYKQIKDGSTILIIENDKTSFRDLDGIDALVKVVEPYSESEGEDEPYSEVHDFQGKNSRCKIF